MSNKKQTNVFVVMENGERRYFVGYYRDGHYERPLSMAERKATGCSAEFGSLSYLGCPYTNLASARCAARRHYGYSKVGNA